MVVTKFESIDLGSNTYLMSQAKSNRVWLVDLGAFDKVLDTLKPDQMVAGVLLTHYHYDHIYFINTLIDVFPDCAIYASMHTIEGLYDPRMNLSFYHEDPVIFRGNPPTVINDNDEITLFDQVKAYAYATPGHNPGCISYRIQDYFFTGDSYIPDLDVVTKLKGGSKSESLRSLLKIKNLLSADTIVCPGHGECCDAPHAIGHIHKLLKIGYDVE